MPDFFTSSDIKYGSSTASLCKELKRRGVELSYNSSHVTSHNIGQQKITWTIDKLGLLPTYHYLILGYLSLEVILLG